MPRRFTLTKHGLATDPRNQNVSIVVSGREYLGTVLSAYYDSVTGRTRLQVRHFNGDSWPFDPPASQVEII